MLSFNAFQANFQSAVNARAAGNDAAVAVRARTEAAVERAYATLQERATRQPARGSAARPVDALPSAERTLPTPGTGAPNVQFSPQARQAAASPAASVQLPASAERLEEPAFRKLKSVSRMQSVQRSMDFSLTTADGDRVTISLESLDYSASTRFRGVTDDGTRVRARASESETTRAYSLSVEGDLDADERAAIDDLLDQVVDVAEAFFSGDDKDALGQALAMDYDTAELTGFALDLAQTETRAVEQLRYKAAPAQLSDLAARDAGVAEMFANLAGAARGLIDQASTLLEPVSAANIGLDLLPVFLDPVMGELDDD